MPAVLHLRDLPADKSNVVYLKGNTPLLEPSTLTVLSNTETRQAKPHGSLLTTEEAAAYLAISAETLRRLCRRKAITFIQITPSEYRFDLPDLREYVNSRRNRRKSAIK